MPEKVSMRLTTLANGDTVSIADATHKFALLKSYLENPDLEWDPLYYLREVCFGNQIEPEQVRTLAREGLLMPDGEIDPLLKAVVLSATRGQGHVLHLDSPFTNSLDRAIADFISARDYLFVYLPQNEFNELLKEDVAKEARTMIEQEIDANLPAGLRDKQALADTIWQQAQAERKARRTNGSDTPPL